jgi:hypothetical protein
MNRSYPEGIRLLLCAGTGRRALAVLLKESAETKDAERRDKVSVRTREGCGAGKVREPSKRQAIPAKGDRWLVSERQPES